MVLRRIPAEIPNIDELGLPEILKELVMHKRADLSGNAIAKSHSIVSSKP